MVLFLTSHIGGSYKKDGVRIPTKLCEENNESKIYGSAYLITDGRIEQICEEGKVLCMI